ncbi:MAG: hypothetical protein AAGU75_21435, partial [Bacillota bacterium]
MKKVCNKWKVFLIVLCMLFTMFPSAVMAEEPSDPITVETPVDSPAVDPEETQKTEPQPDEPDGTPPVVEPVTTPPAITPEDSTDSTDGDQTDTVSRGSIEFVPLFVAPPPEGETKLILSYLGDNEGGNSESIVISQVIYSDGFGFQFTNNPNTIKIENYIFNKDSETASFNASNYVPDKIIDQEGATWELTDKGKGQRKNIEVHKYDVGDKNHKEFHYKKCLTTGTLTIMKEIKNNVPIPETTFTFNIYKWIGYGIYGDKFELVKSVSINGAGSTEPIKLEPGYYKITEVDDPNDDFRPVNGEQFKIVC